MLRLLAVLSLAGLALAAPAGAADTTFTQTVTPGGAFRTAEGPPTADTPLIVSGTISQCSSNCPPGPLTLTIKFHGEDAGDINGEGFEGESWEAAAAGPWVDVILSGGKDQFGAPRVGVNTLTFDVDKSGLYPGFTGLGGRSEPQLGSMSGPVGKAPKPGTYSN